MFRALLKKAAESVFTKSRLRQRFLRFFLLVGLVPLLLMGFVGIYLVNRVHRYDVATLERTIIEQNATEIGKFIGEAIGLFQLQVGYEKYAEIELNDQRFLLERMLEENAFLDEVAFISLSGKETAKLQRSATFASELLDQHAHPKFLVAKDGRDYFGPITFENDTAHVAISSPVINRNSQIIGVLTGGVNLKSIQENFKEVKLGAQGYLYLADTKGNIIAHSRGVDIGENIAELPMVRDVIAGIQRNGLGENDIYESRWNEEVIGSGNLIQPFGWVLVAEWPLTDAQGIVGLMLSQLAQFAFATIVLVVLIASFVAFQLMRPIEELKESARIIGEGKFEHRVKLRTGDEIEELGHSLNKMAENLKGLEELRELKLKTRFLAESLAKEKELSKAKDQFISVASHQLFTPLSVINWGLESLRSGKLSKEMKQGLLTMDQSRQDILNIVNDLLAVSEIGFKYQKTKSEVLHIGEVIESVLAKLSKKAEAKKVNVEFKNKAADDKGDFSRFAMEKVFENLIDNAITYSHDGGTVTLALSGDPDSLTFSITDQGIGIPQDEQSSIFQEFFRAKNAVAKKNVGTGLGLFIVKSIIEGHGGEVSFTSQENKGSTFTFTLPRK